MRACLLLIVLGLLGCQSILESRDLAARPPGQHIEIQVSRCASEDELRYGDIGEELWGEGWHYVENLFRCAEA